jgi:hypothetical protein
MKACKNIFVLVLLILTVVAYLGHDIVNYYGHITDKIENSANNQNSQRLVSQETTLEGDFHLNSLRNIVQITNPGCEDFTSITSFLLPTMYYSIWLPPENS